MNDTAYSLQPFWLRIQRSIFIDLKIHILHLIYAATTNITNIENNMVRTINQSI
jgi:hypothetical protein